MVAIPGWAYITVGAFISIVSLLVRLANKEQNVMIFFFIVGIVFILVGVAKIVWKRAK